LYTFSFATESEVISKARELKLYKKLEWKSLLHFRKGLDIQDPSFILSKKFSLENELIATIKAFYEPASKYKDINNHPQCRFPARKLFIMHELNISKDEFPTINCPELKIYETKAPADNIYLVYVSENVINPPSMMGHTFLKYSGLRNDGRKVEHAVTFYTIIQSQNPLTLIYQNLFSGMPGLFSLQPYRYLLYRYTINENRNVWEYKLSLSKYRKKLIYYHVWELKDVKMKYFFINYNCSTVIYYMLSLANPNIYNEYKLWMTPLDTVKLINKYNMVKDKKLIASNRWIIKMILENSISNKINDVKDIVINNNIKKISTLDFPSTVLLYSYNELEYNKNNIDENKYKIIKKLATEKLNKTNFSFDISKYKNPNKIPNERQFSFGYINIQGEKYLKIDFLPASHLLSDNNRQYFGESELKIFHFSFLLNKNHLDLNEFTPYSMKSIIPYDTFTHDLSYQFYLGIKKEYSKDFQLVHTYKIDGGMGIDFLLGNDINIFAMLNLGIGYNNQANLHAFFNPQIGLIIYEIFHMKSLIYYQPLYINTEYVYNKFVLNHNIFLSKNSALYFNFSKIAAVKKNKNIYEFGVKILF